MISGEWSVANIIIVKILPNVATQTWYEEYTKYLPLFEIEYIVNRNRC